MQVGNLLSGVALGWMVATFGLDDALTLPWSDNAPVGTHPTPVVASAAGTGVDLRPTPEVDAASQDRARQGLRRSSSALAHPARALATSATESTQHRSTTASARNSNAAQTTELCPTNVPAEEWGETRAGQESPWPRLSNEGWVSELPLLADPWTDD